MRKLEIADADVMRHGHNKKSLGPMSRGTTIGCTGCCWFRLRKPRPQVAQSDSVKVAGFKKTASSGKAPGR